MEKSLPEIALIILVGYLLLQRYRQTRIIEYALSTGVIGVFYLLFFITGSKLFVYLCFLILAILFFKIWKGSTR